MPTDCKNCPLRRKDIFLDMSEDEVAFTRKFKTGELRIGAGAQILLEGSNSPQLFTALSGQGLRYKTLPNGRRQVLNFVFPGAFLGLQAGVMKEMQHSVEATTEMVLCVFERRDFYQIFRNHPERAFDLTWLAASEEHFLGEALASVGQLPAVERMAWAILSLYEHADALGLLKNGAVPMPYRQQDLADALGLSLVHTNKTLARLRDRQLASWTEGWLKVHDIDALRQITGMDAESARAPRPLL
ncbi:Crp/Fnr family transcriptional regulator [Histidinibacterium aquaticum]|uniref:Crp/Fnr family transcriptional regulator n=1 Tax=Histidinibacterium aquaticum TaxID=2613962 RepID=A0A5J5GKF1_9RHOB|nr:Crp/Fnr family transcriptional regulator [Histidinibacterium aquaticum]KAA9007952.1 Crp/Fnr family transcriptional regulator [Histidinibacterium aquaticum]